MSETAQELIQKALGGEPKHRAYCELCERQVGGAYYSAIYTRDLLAQHHRWAHPETVKWDNTQGRQQTHDD